MAYRIRRRGFGVLNPTAGTALDCGLTAGGVFNKACWCLSWPSLCSAADYQAAYALANPGVYAPIQAPPTVQAPAGSAITVPPASGADAQATIDAVLAQQEAAAQAQNAATMQQTAANLQAAAQTQCPGATLVQNADGSWSCPTSTNWLLYGAIALAAVFGLSMLGGHH